MTGPDGPGCLTLLRSTPALIRYTCPGAVHPREVHIPVRRLTKSKRHAS